MIVTPTTTVTSPSTAAMIHSAGASTANGSGSVSPFSAKSICNDDTQMPFFHGNITREKTEKLLKSRSDGTFLIRNSTNYPGDFTLCVACNGKVEHYRIYLINGQLSCDKEEMFDNLTQLVSHYKRDADGLCHRLVTPLVSDAFKLSCESANWEERKFEFRQGRVLIPRAELKLGDVIGHGEFGDVLLGHYANRKVAVKMLKNGMASDLLNEAKFMIDLHHPHLVGLLGVVMEESCDVYMLTEFMSNGNLVDYLRSRGRHQVERSQLVHFALDVATGMAYMESRQAVHRDLAARNILLDENFNAKVSDFGLAQFMNQPVNDSIRGKFPIKWTAPEALRHSTFTNKSDVWSFSIVLWELFSFGRIPYPRIPIQDVVRHIEQGYRMEPPEGCPPSISGLMSECWALEASNRPTFAEIVVKLRRISNYPGGC
uniref:Tyrosine-protein kinase n=1 Tax=Panagrellus redivivus TaxID=6233 RepID=A0A7E4VUC4_PANRE